ncbi:MAG: UDP-N-acetylmuramoyl-tripeptide--D-alanyl-D-alanine ligase [Bacteroidota bacterium]
MNKSNPIEDLYSLFLDSTGISIDTRTIEPGNIFFSISGPNFNANEFALTALEKGASFAVVDQAEFVVNEKTILVEDGLAALQLIAKTHRAKFRNPVLGITGSNGKTTTKELIYAVLSKSYRVHATKGNYNNHIGVPLTLLGIQKDTELAIIEMGANHVGEIASYCEIAQPTHGLITNIGRAHTETFGGIEGVIRGKSELFDFLRRHDGIPFINLSDKVLNNMAKRFENYVGFPEEEWGMLEVNPFLTFQIGGQKVKTQLHGKYNFANVSAAVAVGRFFKVSNELIFDAISTYVPENARSQVIKQNGVRIILDAYNANPDSMKVALESLSEQKGNTVAVLGDMNELENPDESHTEILNFAKELGISKVLTVGAKIGRVADPETHFDTKAALEKFLSEINLNGATVLLKASRSIKLETTLKSLR